MSLYSPDKKNTMTQKKKKFGNMEETYKSGAGQITFAQLQKDEDDPVKYATITTTGKDFNLTERKKQGVLSIQKIIKHLS